MANEKILDTVIVLRNDSSTNWATSEVVLLEGETGISYLDNGNVIVKVGNGVDKWADLPQVESVLENDIMLTHSVGKYVVPAGSHINAGGKNKTFVQWFTDAYNEIVEPTVVLPNVSLRATASNTGADLEIGSYITKLSWSGASSMGSYKIDTITQPTGLTANDFSWDVSNNIDAQHATTEDGSFTLATDNRIQINSTEPVNYAVVSATVTLDPSNINTPVDNMGNEVNSKKITGFDTEGTTTKTLNANISATGYRNSWYYVGTDCETPVDSAFIRGATAKNANTTTFGTIEIPQGTKRVMFAVPGAHTLVSVIDVKGMGLNVKPNFITSIIPVEGANGFAAIDYTVFVAENPVGLAATKYTITIE